MIIVLPPVGEKETLDGGIEHFSSFLHVVEKIFLSHMN